MIYVNLFLHLLIVITPKKILFKQLASPPFFLTQCMCNMTPTLVSSIELVLHTYSRSSTSNSSRTAAPAAEARQQHQQQGDEEGVTDYY